MDVITRSWAEVGAALGVSLDDAASIGHGQGRSWRATVAGEPVVVKWGLDPELPEKITNLAGEVPELRRRGTPAPAIREHGPIRPGAGYAWIQEALPGEPADTMPPWLVEALLAVVAGHADAPPGPHRADFNRWVHLVVHEDADGWRSRATAIDGQLCARLQAWVGQVPAPAPRHDYVHADLNLSNALNAGEQLTGIVDLEDVAYEVIGRLGWRGKHGYTADWDRLATLCRKFLDTASNGRAGQCRSGDCS